MPKKGHSEEQILRALRQAESGTRVSEICGLHPSTQGKRLRSACGRRHWPLSFLCRSVSKHDRDAAYLRRSKDRRFS